MTPYVFSELTYKAFPCFSVDLMDQTGTSILGLIPETPKTFITFDFKTDFTLKLGTLPVTSIGFLINKFYYYQTKIQNLFNSVQLPSLAPVNVEIRHECYTGIGVTPTIQPLTYTLYMPDVSMTFQQFKVGNVDSAGSCPINYSLLNYADNSTVSSTDPYSSVLSGTTDIIFTAKYQTSLASVGVKSFYIKGTISYSNTPDTYLRVDVNIICDPVSINPDPVDSIVLSPQYQTKEYKYTVGQDPLKIPYK